MSFDFGSVGFFTLGSEHLNIFLPEKSKYIDYSLILKQGQSDYDKGGVG